MIRLVSRVASAVLVAGLALSSTAHAGPKRVAVVGVEIGGDGAPELQTQLAESVVAGLAAAGVKTVELADVREALRSTPELLGCISSTCLARIGEKVGADGFVRGRVTAEGADYTVELELYNTDEVLHRIEKECTVCTIGELNTLAQTTAKLLIEGASDSPIQVTIRTEPSGAEISIDGQSRGPAPFEGPLSRGPHLLVARATSGKIVRQRIEVSEASAGQPMVIRIEEPTVVRPPTPQTDSTFGAWRWVAAGGAISAVALGATLIIIDGRGTCDKPEGECPRIRKTQTGGFVSLGVGAVLAGVAGYMFYSDVKNRENATLTPTVAVGSGAAHVGLSLTF